MLPEVGFSNLAARFLGTFLFLPVRHTRSVTCHVSRCTYIYMSELTIYHGVILSAEYVGSCSQDGTVVVSSLCSGSGASVQSSQVFFSPTHPFLPYVTPHFFPYLTFYSVLAFAHPHISPICRTPLFPYLTFYSVFSGRQRTTRVRPRGPQPASGVASPTAAPLLGAASECSAP